MKILLANKFYYRRGGDCIYTMSLEQLLKNHGHEVAIFAMEYPENEESEWSQYFPKEMNKFMAFTRPFGSREVRHKFEKLIKDFNPDVIHLNNIHTQISPIIAEIAHNRGIRVVWTLHDSKLVCPCYTCMKKGKWCTECFNDKKAVIKNRCMPGGLIGSIIGFLEQRKWNPNRIQPYIDLFLPPSKFMADTCIAGGYNENKFKVLCNFIDDNKVKQPCFEKEDYYVFLGRLASYKGIRNLCKVASELPYKLIIIGTGELEEELQKQYAKYNQIKFIGQKKWNELRPVLEKAKFMVIPSEWSENNPLTIIESQSLGTPVLGAHIGGIPELINEGITGMTFKSGDILDLKKKIQLMYTQKFNYQKISEEAINKYSSENYYKNIIKYYK